MPKLYLLHLVIATIVGFGAIRIHLAAAFVLTDGGPTITNYAFSWLFGGCVGAVALAVVRLAIRKP